MVSTAPQFKYKHSELGAGITQSKKEGLITDEERKKMKDYIITKEPDVTLDLETYQKDLDGRKFVESLKVITEITMMASPVDNNLIYRKKRKQHVHKPEKNKKEEEEDITLGNCDGGNSPTLSFAKKIPKNNDDE